MTYTYKFITLPVQIGGKLSKMYPVLLGPILCALLLLTALACDARSLALQPGRSTTGIGVVDADPTAADQSTYFQRKVVAPDGAAGDEFGWAVALDGDTALVGARYTDVGGRANQGAVYVFVRSGTTWSLQQKLTASDGAVNESFGASVALDGSLALVGAPGHDISRRASQGAAYVFARSGTTWTEQAKLTAADGTSEDRCGAQ